MNKLSQEEGEELYQLLKELKRNNWILDLRENGVIISTLIEWHCKIYEFVNPYDEIRDFEEQLCMITADLCDYFKSEKVVEEIIKCKKCGRKCQKIDINLKGICRKCVKTKY